LNNRKLINISNINQLAIVQPRELSRGPKTDFSAHLGISENLGKLLENQVYLDLRRQGKKIFYYHTSDGYEIDFITQDHQGKYEIIQVVWEVNDPLTLERETRALRQAEQELGFPGRLIDCKSYLMR